MISIGGVIGTGLFLGSAVGFMHTLYTTNSFPASECTETWWTHRRSPWVLHHRHGRLLSLCLRWRDDRVLVSTSRIVVHFLFIEEVADRPNVGGVVGLADLYVDPAVGFSMGWAAWYNWSVILRTSDLVVVYRVIY